MWIELRIKTYQRYSIWGNHFFRCQQSEIGNISEGVDNNYKSNTDPNWTRQISLSWEKVVKMFVFFISY